ncbi:MAG: hypothetical protein Q8K93_00025 [Reyranella sp.]|nr:hypothetical protein [Reyranella sp.]
MCQFQNLRSSIDAGPVLPPPAEGARALYPSLGTNESGPASPPSVVPLQWSDIGTVLWQPKSNPSFGPALPPDRGGGPEASLPSSSPGPIGQRPKIVEANAGRVLVEIAKRAGALLRREEPTPVPPPPVPPSTPAPEPPRLPPTPDKPPELPKNEGFIPPDLKGILKPIAGGDFTIPPGGPITFPGKVPDNVPGILVLAIEMLHGEQKGGAIGKVGHVEEADLAVADPMYGRFKKVLERAAEIVGPGKGPERGKSIHAEVQKLIREEFTEEERKHIHVEYTAGEKKNDDPHYSQKRGPRIDIYRRIGDDEARLYEVKTGSAREKEARIYRLFNDTFFGKIKRTTVTEIWVP